jgi:hypothetical protein
MEIPNSNLPILNKFYNAKASPTKDENIISSIAITFLFSDYNWDGLSPSSGEESGRYG